MHHCFFFLECQSTGGARKGCSQCPALLQDNRGQNGCGAEGAGDASRLSQQGAWSHPSYGSGWGPSTAQVSGMFGKLKSLPLLQGVNWYIFFFKFFLTCLLLKVLCMSHSLFRWSISLWASCWIILLLLATWCSLECSWHACRTCWN